MSHLSARMAGQNGYKNVVVYAAGIKTWQKAAGTASAQSVVAPSGQDGTIDITVFEKILARNPDSIQLIDVRDKDEYDAGHFKPAVNIPTDDLEKTIKTLSDEKSIVFVCNTGAKSGEAYYMLEDLRPDLKKVYYLDAETEYKKDGTFKIKKPK
ncbi:rhodanese-like domain-containing protein [Desulfobacula sp.]